MQEEGRGWGATRECEDTWLVAAAPLGQQAPVAVAGGGIEANASDQSVMAYAGGAQCMRAGVSCGRACT